MSDELLRELERRYQASGGAADGAVWLRERVRRGDLPLQRLELAAYLGHEPARLALGDTAPAAVAPATEADLDRWARGLQAYDRDACPRAALAAGRAAAQLWAEAPERDPQLVRFQATPELQGTVRIFGDVRAWARGMLEVLDLVEAWIETPKKAAKQALAARVPRPDESDGDGWFMHVPLAIHAAWRWCLRPGPRRAAVSEAGFGATCLGAAYRGEVVLEQVHALTARDAIRDALLPWVLACAAGSSPRRPARRAKARRPGGPTETSPTSVTVGEGVVAATVALRVFGQRGDEAPRELGRTPAEAVAVRDCSRWWVRPNGVREVQRAESLRGVPGLWLRGLKVRDEHLAGVAALVDLRWLDLRNCGLITDAGLEALAPLERLEALDLWGCRGIHGVTLGRLPQSLADLSLARTGLSPAAWRGLAGRGRLRRLDLNGCAELRDVDLLTALEGLDGLEELDLEGARSLTDAGLEALLATPRLRRLSLKHVPIGDAGLEPLAELGELEELSLWGAKVRGGGLEALTGLPNLRRLCLAGCPLRVPEVQERLPRLTSLRHLDLRCDNQRLDRWAAKALARPDLDLRLGYLED